MDHGRPRSVATSPTPATAALTAAPYASPERHPRNTTREGSPMRLTNGILEAPGRSVRQPSALRQPEHWCEAQSIRPAQTYWVGALFFAARVRWRGSVGRSRGGTGNMNRIRAVVVAAGLALLTSPVVAGADQPAARTFLAVARRGGGSAALCHGDERRPGPGAVPRRRRSSRRGQLQVGVEQPARRHRRGPHPSGTGGCCRARRAAVGVDTWSRERCHRPGFVHEPRPAGGDPGEP